MTKTAVDGGYASAARVWPRPWHRKLVLDTVKAVMPFQNPLRALWRRFAPYQTNPANDRHLLHDAIELAVLARPAGKVVLEFGSGWNPLLPLIFRLTGAARVVLTDQERLLDHTTLCHALDMIEADWPRIRDALGVPDDHKNILMADRARPLPDLLATLGLRYLVPFEPASLAAGSVDIIVSRAVLEHVPEPVLVDMLAHFRRILAPGGLMLHRIDMSDHWEHGDKSISKVNFLRYPNWLWRMTELNPQNVQNRLRRTDYVRMFEQAGFRDVQATGETHEASLAAVRKMPLAPRFAKMPLEDLAVIETTVTARA